jgi:hypothetical protein
MSASTSKIFSICGPTVSARPHDDMIFAHEYSASRVWLFPADLSTPDAANFIYCRNLSIEKSAGFGGAGVTFRMSDGTTKSLQGPWNSNADALFEQTGVDLRNSNITFGIVAKSREHIEFSKERFSDILHEDLEPTSGRYDRIPDLAQDFANRLNSTIYFAYRARGGGSSGHKHPKKESV